MAHTRLRSCFAFILYRLCADLRLFIRRRLCRLSFLLRFDFIWMTLTKFVCLARASYRQSMFYGDVRERKLALCVCVGASVCRDI